MVLLVGQVLMVVTLRTGEGLELRAQDRALSHSKQRIVFILKALDKLSFLSCQQYPFSSPLQWWWPWQQYKHACREEELFMHPSQFWHGAAVAGHLPCWLSLRKCRLFLPVHSLAFLLPQKCCCLFFGEAFPNAKNYFLKLELVKSSNYQKT